MAESSTCGAVEPRGIGISEGEDFFGVFVRLFFLGVRGLSLVVITGIVVAAIVGGEALLPVS